jgi:hypothetical protein
MKHATNMILYMRETRSLALKEEHKLRVFVNKVLGEYLDLRERR